MPLLLAAALAVQVQIQVSGGRSKTVVRDSISDSVDTRTGRRRRIAYRQPVTAAVLASAFKDAAARPTLMRARAARLRQDSALFAYDATTYQRIKVGMGFANIGRDRVLFINESVTHVRWQNDVGAHVEMKGARTAIPMASSKDAQDELRDDMSDDMMSPIPYYPGYESLWIGGGAAKAQVDESEIVHPLGEGSEAYYTYETGDSISFRLPDGKTIRLGELRVRPRSPKWNLAVGSLWLDNASGQLVRAAYRMAVPIDVWTVVKEQDSTATKDIPVWVKPLISPIHAQITAIAVEYGLHDGRFWLPRIRAAEGDAQVSFMRVPFKMEQSFKYASVNTRADLPKILIDTTRVRARLDTMTDEQRQKWRDSVRVARRASRDSVKNGLKSETPHIAECDTSKYYHITQYRYGEAHLAVSVTVPCDISALENSPDLPGSIYDPNDELFGAKERDELISQALSLGAQPPLMIGHLPPPTVKWGSEFMRFNRIEGFSMGARVDQQLGGGYNVTALGRFGFADRDPNLELTGTRTNLIESVHVGGYRHLVSASDWGRPLSFGSSLSAALFGRDEGFYYRATGAELGGSRAAAFGRGVQLDWRFFVENQTTAERNLSSAVNGSRFIDNLAAQKATYTGGALELRKSFGLDPRGLRVFSDFRLEAATGDSVYGRGALDVTVSHGLGALAGALTLAGGSSIGALPPQRLWYLGGSQTIRGQAPDTAQSGNAFWFTRAELGTNEYGARPVVFADLGWVGNRDNISRVGRPMSGVGAGMSFVDGLIRFDLARGLYPRKQWRVDMSVEARF